MRIVHVAPFYAPVIGGVETVVRRICEHLAQKGHDVWVVTYNRSRRRKNVFPFREEIRGVKVVRLAPKFYRGCMSYSDELPNLIRQLNPELVHVHVWRHPHVFQVAKLKSKLRFKAVLHPHSPFHGFKQLGLFSWSYHKFVDSLFRKTLRAYDAVIALTPHERAVLVRGLKLPLSRVEIIPNGVDDALLRVAKEIARRGDFVLYVGRICKTKNLLLLIKAMLVVNETLDIPLKMVGPPDSLLPQLEKFATRRGVRFEYLGVLGREQLYETYASCLIYAHPALYEPYGIALMEAQAFGNPCVITGYGGQLYAAPPGLTSLHAEPKPDSFGRAILSLLEDPALYARLSRNAVNWASKHVWSRLLPKYDSLYARLTEGTTRCA